MAETITVSDATPRTAKCVMMITSRNVKVKITPSVWLGWTITVVSANSVGLPPT